MAIQHRTMRGFLAGLAIVALVLMAPSGILADGSDDDDDDDDDDGGGNSECVTGCFGSFIGCAIDAFHGCFAAHPGDRRARRACIRDALRNTCRPNLRQCVAECRDTGTQEAP